MKNGDGVQVQQNRTCEFCGCVTNAIIRACCHKGRVADTPVRPDIQVKSSEWLLRDKVKALQEENALLLSLQEDAQRIIRKKNDYIDILLKRLGR